MAMEASILRGLNDKMQVVNADIPKISSIIDQLCGMFSSSSAPLSTRNGGLIGLAATAIALGQRVSPFLGVIIPPILACFNDPESRVRYHACESLYNVAKVSKGEILVYFNEIFDALSKLSSDSEMSVKNGAELVDRLMKDIVAEAAPSYISLYPRPGARTPGLGLSPGGANEKDKQLPSPVRSVRPGAAAGAETTLDDALADKRAFSLARFIPLLSERVYVISPYTRMHLVSWIMVLDSVPDLELVAWLPEFLDGLLKYLADTNVDVRLATENVLGEFLREIKYIAKVQEQYESERARREHEHRLRKRASKGTMESLGESAVDDDDEPDAEHGESESRDGADGEAHDSVAESSEDEMENDWEGEGSGAWVPGQGVFVDHAAIMDIMIQHLGYPDELVQSTAMEWILTFLDFAQTTVVAFTPRIVPAILPNLASPHRDIKAGAHETNTALYRVIQSLPLQMLAPHPVNTGHMTAPAALSTAISPTHALSTLSKSQESDRQELDHPLRQHDESSQSQQLPQARSRRPTSEPVTPSTSATEFPKSKTRPQSPVQHPPMSPVAETVSDDDPFDVRETVNVLTLQFLSDHPETRIAALEWLLMLHLKAPTKILSRDSGTFPALLKTLSDPSEDVVKHDLQLLAQISSSSEDAYFTSFMVNVLELFSTDRRLLETRGSLIIRQLCLHLNAEKIFRTLAEILEKDDDLEFASMMVVKLNMILITSPELADFRRRLTNLESKDGQMLFSSLYRSWCHNAVATFALCLLAQAYEHAANLLEIFAELEITVPLLVQIDKLVMLIESPVFTSLRLQLLKPDKYPHLSKCLYGLLMILPQSSAFVSLRARLSVVNSSGYAPVVAPPPKSSFAPPAATGARAKQGKEEIKWTELLSHFQAVQMRHERARRQVQAGETFANSIHFSSPSQTSALQSAAQIHPPRPGPGGTVRRRPEGGTVKRDSLDAREGRPGPAGAGAATGTGTGLSPLNPKRSSLGGIGVVAGVALGGAVGSMTQPGLMRPGSPARRKARK
ncbi:hypothetical protein Q5752_002339 [Cryptotrichosporon argae]